VAELAARMPPLLGRMRPPATMGKKNTDVKVELDDPEKKIRIVTKHVSRMHWPKPKARRFP